MTSYFAGIEAQDGPVTVLERAIANDRLASAYLFHGPSGVGKERVALALARACVAGDDATIDHRIVGGHHPDVRILRPREEGSRNLQVEFVRTEVLPFAQFAPFEGRAAFVVFPEADVSFPAWYPEAANALLKTLEEPRPNVHFVLVSERPNRLLDTIRSRCQALRFRPLPLDTLCRIVTRELPDLADASVASVAAALAGGRADRALELARSGRVDALFDRALGTHEATLVAKPGGLVATAERLAKLEAHDRVLELETLALLYRDAATLAVLGASGRLLFDHRRDDVARVADEVGAEAIGRREASIRQTLDGFDRSVNVQLALDAMMFGFERMR